APTQPLIPNAVIAGNEVLVDLFSIFYNLRPLSGYTAEISPGVANAEWHRRAALNALASRPAPQEIAPEQATGVEQDHWGPWARSPGGRRALFETRMAAYSELARDPVTSLRRYGVRYVVVWENSGARPQGTKILSEAGYALYEFPQAPISISESA